MLQTYLKIAWRSIQNNKLFSFINVFGLAIGLTCCLLISMYLYKEFSYDRQHLLADRIYQIGTTSIQDGKESRYSTTAAPMAAAMQQEFAEVESTVRLMKLFQEDKTLLQYKEKSEVRSFYETNGCMADSTFFHIFTYAFKEGDPRTALNEPNSVVLSEEIATKIFGNTPALNKIIHINSTTNGPFDFKVTGVFRGSKTPSHIDSRFFMSMQSGEVGPWLRQVTGMVNNNLFFTYLLLKEKTDPRRLEAKFEGFIKKYAGEDLKSQGRWRTQFLIPIKDVYLKARTLGNFSQQGSLSYLYILISIAIVTLIIACVNFMNLSTARSSKRAVEIGVRKVLGAEKRSLVLQFLWEAIVLSVIAFTLSVFLCFLLLPLFETIAGKEFYFTTRQYGMIFGAFILVTLVSGLVAGLYPAFYLSAFKPVKVLKGRFSNSLSATFLRKGLVVFQFVISVALVVASITIGNQMRYLRNKDLGFNRDQQIVVPLRTSTARQVYPSFKNTLVNNSNIASTGASIYYPGIENVTDWLLYKQGTPPDQTKIVYINRVDNSYLQTMGFRLVAGRLFSKDFPADTANRMVLNENAVKAFGFTSAADAVGKNIAATRDGQEVPFPIIGVVKDFHFKGLHAEIEPYGFLLNREGDYTYLIARVEGQNTASALKSMSAAWGKLNPNEPFEYSFLDDDFQKNYVAEERLAALIRYLTIIAIFISCLGLFGLTTFSVEQRTKEIGIRKVLGASTTGIVSLLSKDYLKLVLLSFLIASPLAWYFINNWLQGFAYRAPFTVWIILAGWAVALIVAFLTISAQAIKAAIANPVKNLRTE